jgi:hypothetical protein
VIRIAEGDVAPRQALVAPFEIREAIDIVAAIAGLRQTATGSDRDNRRTLFAGARETLPSTVTRSTSAGSQQVPPRSSGQPPRLPYEYMAALAPIAAREQSSQNARAHVHSSV